MAVTGRVVRRRLLLWTAVCSVSAAPSFLWAVDQYDRLAMLTGVACFILLLTAITCTARFERFKKRPFMRRTLFIGYGSRVFLSLLFPVGMVTDMYPGLLSIMLIESLGFAGESYLGTLLITLVQGTILNCVISLFMLLVYVFQRMFCRKPSLEPACERCGYDLRGNVDSPLCPECGTAVGEVRRAA